MEPTASDGVQWGGEVPGNSDDKAKNSDFSQLGKSLERPLPTKGEKTFASQGLGELSGNSGETLSQIATISSALGAFNAVQDLKNHQKGNN
jgi:hypothetical protein